MTSFRIIRLLLIAIACGWGTSAFAAKEAMTGDETLPQLIGELQHMSPDQCDEKFSGFDEEQARASALEQEQRRQWLKRQWAALSPEERDLLHRQIIEYCQHMTPEDCQRMREIHQKKSGPADDNPGWQEHRSQRLSPEERQEFHHWMRIRRGGPA